VVTGAAPKQQILLDRTVYSVSADLQTTTGTAADVLNQIPSVDVDADGNLTLRGDPNVTVLIDGKPSAQFSGTSRGFSLQQVPARNIDRIEVMTNPPAQYKAQGSAGVINIITKKSGTSGLSGSGDLSLGDKRRFLASLSGAYNVGKLRLSAGVTVRQEARERQVVDYRTAVDPATGELVKSQENVDEHFKRLISTFNLGADYDFNDRQSLSLSLSHRELHGKRFFLQQDQSGPPEGPPDTVSDRHSDGHEYALDEGEGLRFDQKFALPGELLSISFQRSVYREREHYAYVNDYLLPVAPPSQDLLHLSQDLVKLEAAVDYTLPIGGGRTLKLGYDFEDDSNRFDNVGANIDALTGAAVNNPNVTNHFRYHQQVSAGYGQIEAPFGPWTLQTGVRLEQTDIHDLLFAGDVTGAQSYFQAYPSLNLDRKLGHDGKLTWSISRRITRPDSETLNPFIDYQDIYNLRAGNANLLPQDTWSYEFGYAGRVRALNYRLTAYYKFNRDTAIPVTVPVTAVVTLTTIENLSKSKAAGLDFSADGKLGSHLSYAVSGNLFYSQIDGTAFATRGLRDTVGLNGKASLDWRPTAADTAQISFSRTDRRLTPQGYVSAINLVNFGYQRRLWRGLSAVATVADLFDGQRFQRIVNTPTLQDNYNRHQFGRVGYFGLAYTFGLSRTPKPDPFDDPPVSRN
jgi:outer membrane receptor protein involved in Fe transport